MINKVFLEYPWMTTCIEYPVIRIRKCMAMLGLRVNQGFRITGSRKSGRLQAGPNIVRQREQHVYDIVAARLI